jgi:hypothetical protein
LRAPLLFVSRTRETISFAEMDVEHRSHAGGMIAVERSQWAGCVGAKRESQIQLRAVEGGGFIVRNRCEKL